MLPSFVNGEPGLRGIVGKEAALQTVCNHPFMIPYFTQWFHKRGAEVDAATVAELTLKSSGKLAVLDYILRCNRALGQKVVLFSHWLDTIDLITEHLSTSHLSYSGFADSYVTLTGDSSVEER